MLCVYIYMCVAKRMYMYIIGLYVYKDVYRHVKSIY